MVRKPPNSKAFCMFSSVDTQAGTIGPVNRLPFVYVTLLFFLFIFADSTRESIVCVCVRYTSYTQPNSQKPPHEMRTSKRTRKNVQRKRKKQKRFDVNGLMDIHSFFFFKFLFHWYAKSVRSLHTWNAIRSGTNGQLPKWGYLVRALGWW